MSAPELATPESPHEAPFYPIGTQIFQSVEYPGPIGPSSSSLSAALKTLGQPEDWNPVFNKTRANLELRFRPDDHWAHPVPGDRTGTHRVLVKVTRRRRRRPQQAGDGAAEPSVEKEEGVYKIELPGTVKQTVRFRAMADYQYTPSPDAHIVKLIEGLRKADYETFSAFEFDPPNEDYYEPLPTGHPIGSDDHNNDTENDIDTENNNDTENDNENDNGKTGKLHWDDKITHRSRLGILPPPQFSTQSIPARFTFEHGPNSKLEPYTNPIKGNEGYRFVNRHKNVALNFRQIRHVDPSVPLEPPLDIKAALKYVKKETMELVRQKFEERPMWSRLAIQNQFDAETRRLFMSKHAYLPGVAYVIVDGPFRDNLIRLGYDPRKDPSMYKYQRIYFRNMRADGGMRMTLGKMQVKDPELAVPRSTEWQTEYMAERMKELHGKDFTPDATKSHLFDGKTLHRDVGNFQVCDISDPLLKSLIHDPRALSTELDDAAGWYKPRQYYAIKALLRLKWQALVEGKEPSAEKMQEIVAQFNDFESAASAYVADNDDESTTPAPRQKRKPRAKRAEQSALDEKALATGSRMYKGPLSDAAQQEQRLRGAKPRTRMATVTTGRDSETEGWDASSAVEQD